MIVIFCTKEDNYTHQIIEWLNSLNVNFEKIDLTEKKISDFEIDISNNDFSLKINSILTINYSDVSYFLYRDGFIELDEIELKSPDDKVVNKYLEFDQKTILDFVYNKIMEKSLALSPTYFDNNSREKIEDLFVACVIDLNLNASLSYHPNHLVCDESGRNKILLFTKNKNIYLIDENEFKALDLTQYVVDMKMTNITERVNNCDDLKSILNL